MPRGFSVQWDDFSGTVSAVSALVHWRIYLLIFLQLTVHRALGKEPASLFYFDSPPSATDHWVAVGASRADDRFGSPDHAYYLHGTDHSYINLGTGKQLKPKVGSFSMWFNIDMVTYNGTGYKVNPLVLTKSVCEDDFYEAYSILFESESRKLVVTSSINEANQVSLVAHEPLALHEWYHIVFTWTETELRLYLNGVLQGKMRKNFGVQYLEGDSVMIGNTANAKNQRYFRGYVDDIGIYHHVLSEDEVAELYNAPNPNFFASWLSRWIYVIILVLAMCGVGLAFVAYYKRELRKEQERSGLLERIHSMELEIFRSQMNPHFIFNALNSLQQLILSNRVEEGHKYLGTFSKLLRTMLESNRKSSIKLEEEMNFLTGYLLMERLRFKDSFSFQIVMDPSLDTAKISIPQMLIQPLVENAVWHGLLNKTGDRRLTVKFLYFTGTTVDVEVDDNGVGRPRSPEQASGFEEKKSRAMTLIKERLAMMARETGLELFIHVMDKLQENDEPGGTMVLMRIPVI